MPLAAAVALAGMLSLFPITSFDVWWHLRTGDLILATHAVPTSDPFSFTAFGRPWVSHEWLTEVLMALLFRLGGADLLVVTKAVLAAVAVALGAVAGIIGRSAITRLPAAAVGAVLAAPMIAARAFARPHMVTALLLGVTLVLVRLEIVGRRRWAPWALVPLMAVWANLHSGFVLGLLLVSLSWLGDLFGGPRRTAGLWWRRAAALTASTGAAMLNPHGVGALLYPLRLVSRPEVSGSIVELRSILHPAYRGALFLDALGLAACVVAVLLVRSRRRLDWSLLVPAAAFAALAVATLRGVSELAVVLPAVVAAHGELLGSTVARRRGTGAVVLAAVVAIAVVVVVHGQPMGADPPRRCGLGVDRANWPIAAARFLGRVQPAGNTYNPLPFGGVLIHELWPGRRVFLDGRLDVYPPQLLTAATRLVDTGEGWDELVERYDLGSALVSYSETPERDRGLRARLRRDPAWVCVFFGDNALVYARRRPDNQALIASLGTPFDPSLRSRGSVTEFGATASPADLEQAIRATAEISRFAPTEAAPELVLAELLLVAGRPEAAIAPARRSLAAAPFAAEGRLVLIEALHAAGRGDEALEVADRASGRRRDRVAPLLALADLEHAAGDLGATARALERAAELDPSDAVVRLRLGVVAAEEGRLAEAEGRFEEALHLDPDNAAARRNLTTVRALLARRPSVDGGR